MATVVLAILSLGVSVLATVQWGTAAEAVVVSCTLYLAHRGRWGAAVAVLIGASLLHDIASATQLPVHTLAALTAIILWRTLPSAWRQGGAPLTLLASYVGAALAWRMLIMFWYVVAWALINTQAPVHISPVSIILPPVIAAACWAASLVATRARRRGSAAVSYGTAS